MKDPNGLQQVYMLLLCLYLFINYYHNYIIDTEQVESLPDTGTVSIPRTSLTNMKKIGAGKRDRERECEEEKERKRRGRLHCIVYNCILYV